ncbi:hypothetical protein MMC28_011173 [Mycoblastus sanguinarius]|nr:hypothetical protein [Mycoblastus sanguinarius]
MHSHHRFGTSLEYNDLNTNKANTYVDISTDENDLNTNKANTYVDISTDENDLNTNKANTYVDISTDENNQNLKKARRTAEAAKNLSSNLPPAADTQPYLQQKGELEAEETRIHELEARERMYELDGEDAVYEMQDGDLRQEISTENPRPGMPSLKLRYERVKALSWPTGATTVKSSCDHDVRIELPSVYNPPESDDICDRCGAPSTWADEWTKNLSWKDSLRLYITTFLASPRMWPVGYIIASPYSPLHVERQIPARNWRDSFEDLLALESGGQMIRPDSRKKEAEAAARFKVQSLYNTVSAVNKQLERDDKYMKLL